MMMSTSTPTSPASTTTTKADGKGSMSNSKLLPPKKPYTEYTIFFRLEQSRIVQSTGSAINEEVLASYDPNHYDPLEFPRPSKYQDVIMYPYWYSSSHKAAIEKKRKHRKLKGRMDFKTLSKTISVAWRHADYEVVQYCRKLAKAENEKYNMIVDEINRQEKLLNKVQPQAEAASPPRLVQSTSSTQEELLLQRMFQMQQHTNDALSKMRQFHQLQSQEAFPTYSSDTAALGSTFSVAGNHGNKRKYGNVRRASAPPEFMQNNNNMLPFAAGSKSNMITNISMNTSLASMGNELGVMGNSLDSFNMNVVSTDSSMTSVAATSDVFFGDDNCSPPKQIKMTQSRRRATVDSPFCPDNLVSSVRIFLFVQYSELTCMI